MTVHTVWLFLMSMSIAMMIHGLTILRNISVLSSSLQQALRDGFGLQHSDDYVGVKRTSRLLLHTFGRNF